MPTVQDILETKGIRVFTIDADATALDAIHLMNEHKIGALIATRDGAVVGIFTERDVLRRIAAREVSPASLRVQDAMTADVVCCGPDADVDEASRIMRDRRIRHLPICEENGRLRGIVSIGDLNAYHASHTEAQLHYLNEYVYGRA